MAYTTGNDVNFLQSTDTGIVDSGAGNDRYILSSAMLSANQVITISDAQGVNTLQLVDLTITSSKVLSNAVQLTLSNGAVVNVNGADTFSYVVGGSVTQALSATNGTTQTFSQFATATLGVAAVPAAGAALVSGGAVNNITSAGVGTSTQSFTLTTSAVTVTEGQSAVFTLKPSAALSADLTLTYEISSSNANLTPKDFTGTTSGVVSFKAGDTAAKTITLVAADDGVVEFNEAFTVTVKDSTGASVATANSTVVDSGATTFVLTTSTDGGANFTGSAGNDIFDATTSGTLNDLDSLTGGLGNDVLNATDFTTTAAPTLSGIETLNLKVTGAKTLDLKNATGVTAINNVGSTANLDVNKISLATTALGINAQATGQTNTFNYATGVLSGTADTATLTLTNALGTASFSAVDTNGIETLNLVATGTKSTITLNDAQDTITKVVATGGVNLTLAANEDKIINYDASAFTGAFNVTPSANANVKITGGAGDDTFVLAGGLTSADTLDGGAGNDTVSVSGLITDANIVLTNIEKLAFSGNATQDTSLANLANIGTYVTASGNGTTVTFSNVAAGKAVSIESTGAAATTVYSLKTSTGLTDSVNVSVGSASNVGARVDTIQVNGIETVNLTSVPTSDLAASQVKLTATASNSLKALNISGTAPLTINTGNTADDTVSNVVIDASALSGKLILSEALGSNTTVKGGSNDDTISFVDGDLTALDSIDGGAGNDTFNVTSVAAGTLDLGRPTITNVENLALNLDSNAGGVISLDLRSTVGLQKLTLTVDASGNTADSQAITVNSIPSTTSTIELKSGASGASGVVTLNSTGLTSGNVSLFNGDKYTTGGVALTGDFTALTITDKTAAAYSAPLTLGASVTDLTMSLTQGAFTASTLTGAALKNLTVSGNQAFTVTTFSPSTPALTSFNASNSTGAVTLTTFDRASTATITTGSGDDVIGLAISTQGGNTIDAGTNTTVASASTGDTLKLTGLLTGSTVIDLSSTTDQITTLNGIANAAIQKGFEHFDAGSVTAITSGAVVVTGGSGINVITGTAGADVIDAAAGADTIVGGAGNDVITGGEGADSITGGEGVDSIILTENTAVTDYVLLAPGTSTSVDTIYGFTAGTGGDQLKISLTAQTGSAIVNGSNSAVSAGASTVQLVTTAATITGNVIVMSGTTYASSAALLTAIGTTAGTLLTDTTAFTANNDFVIVWTDTASTPLTHVSLINDANAAAAGATAMATADLTLTDLVTLTGVTTANLVTANFAFIA